MAVDAGEYCENCGSRSEFVDHFTPDRSTRRCLRCGGFSYTGALTRASHELYDREYFFGGEYVDYELSSASQRKNFGRKLTLLAHTPSAPPT